MENDGGMTLTAKTEELVEKPVPVSLCPQHPTWIDLDANPRLRDERPETNRLSNGTAPDNILVK
jgi:hypothetical protein